MPNYSELADKLATYATQQQAIIEIAAAVKEIGSIEQATSERRAALDGIKADHEQAKADLSVTLADLETTKAEIADRLKQAETESARMVEAATNIADGALSEVKKEAARLIEQAGVEASARREEDDGRHASALQALQRTQAEHRGVLTELAAKRDEHARVSAEIESMKARAKSLLTA